MAKVSLETLANLDNFSTAVALLNRNFSKLQAEVELTLSRDGQAPNGMVSTFDMNDNRIINLPYPTSETEPARHGDIQQYVDAAEAAQVAAELAEANAQSSEDDAQVSEDNAAATLVEFESQYLGSLSDSPELDSNGNALIEGALYFDTDTNTFTVYTIDEVLVVLDDVVAGADNVQIRYWTTLPINTVLSMADVDAEDITNDQMLVWYGDNHFVPVDVTAGIVLYDDTTTDLNASNVQEAIEDLVARTSLAAYDISFWAAGLMENNETLFGIIAVRDFTIPVGLPNAQAVAGTAANAETVVTLKKNGVQIGTITWAAAGTSGTFSVPGTVTFSAGDVLTIKAPVSADTTLKDVTITITARR